MGADRLRSRLSPPTPPPAFVPCPAVVARPPWEQAAVVAVYRVAAALTREQLRPRRSRVAAFSAN